MTMGHTSVYRAFISLLTWVCNLRQVCNFRKGGKDARMQGVSSVEVGVAGSGGSLRRYAALSAIDSGVIGLMGFIFLIAFFALEAPAVMKSGNLTASTFSGVLSNI